MPAHEQLLVRDTGESGTPTTPRSGRWWLRAWTVRLLLVSLALAGCTVGDSSEPPPPPPPSAPPTAADECASPAARPDRDASIRHLLTKLTDDTSGGAVLAISKGGEPVRFCAAGRADRAGRELRRDDVFRIGSITKTFVAVLVMQLVEEGRLDLGTPVDRLLPGVPWTTGVTVEQLLNHTSGVPDHYDVLFPHVRADWDRVWTPEEVLTLVDTRRRPFEPGTDQEYSNTNYLLLGMLLEAVTGRSWAELLEERILAPLGLTRTGTGVDGPVPVTGFSSDFGIDRDSEGISYRAMATAAGAAGGMVSTAPDLATFFTALASGELVGRDSLDRMTAFVPSDDGAWYGLGLGLVPFPSGDGFGHGGDIPGYQSLAAVRPESGDLVVVLTNDENFPIVDVERILTAW
ncbi:serine hydrolase domain-containing protein [Actinotalea sp. AC32]|nr:serine hydrolase domain-containing protein [Actinotalea sp. AC32]